MKKIILLVLLIVICGCWKKQSHDITRPVIPHYIFNGTAVDIDNREKLGDISIKMVQERLLYDVEFGTQIVKTDSSGFFQFDSVYPGNYYFSVERSGYYINEQRITISHKDTTALLKVPKIFMGKQFMRVISNDPALAIAGSEAWQIIRKDDLLQPPWPDIKRDFFRIHKYKNYNWQLFSELRSPLNKKMVTGMAFGRDGVFACVSPDSIFVLNRWDGSITSRLTIAVQIIGITFNPNDKSIYTCSKNFIHQHDPDIPGKILHSFNINTPALRSLAYYRNIYSYDNSEYLLRKHDNDISILETYAVINEKSNLQIKKIWDMSFDGYGNLWFSIP